MARPPCASLILLFLAQSVAGAQTPAPHPSAAAPLLLDDGLLDPAWFGGSPGWAKEEEVDFFWMKPGLDLGGRTLHLVAWEDPPMLKAGRDEKDRSKAETLGTALRSRLVNVLPQATGGRIRTSRGEGDLVLHGRVVDCRYIGQSARFWGGMMAGSSTATWDLKLTDPKTGELLLAVHHRTTSSTAMSTLDTRVDSWVESFARLLSRKTLR